VNQKVYQGRKSTTTGIDLEFDKGGIRYIVAIKSGPNWGNSSQIQKMLTDFHAAIKTLRTSGSGVNAICINGCCYGKDANRKRESMENTVVKSFGNSFLETETFILTL